MQSLDRADYSDVRSSILRYVGFSENHRYFLMLHDLAAKPSFSTAVLATASDMFGQFKLSYSYVSLLASLSKIMPFLSSSSEEQGSSKS